jgi:hypothetical protein
MFFPSCDSHVLTMMFKGENIAIELCNPLPTLHREPKGASCIQMIGSTGCL